MLGIGQVVKYARLVGDVTNDQLKINEPFSQSRLHLTFSFYFLILPFSFPSATSIICNILETDIKRQTKDPRPLTQHLSGGWEVSKYRVLVRSLVNLHRSPPSRRVHEKLPINKRPSHRLTRSERGTRSEGSTFTNIRVDIVISL